MSALHVQLLNSTVERGTWNPFSSSSRLHRTQGCSYQIPFLVVPVGVSRPRQELVVGLGQKLLETGFQLLADLPVGLVIDPVGELVRVFQVVVESSIALDESISSRAVAYVEKHFLSHALRLADALIAATAVSHDLTLATGNLKHYRVIDELTLRQFKAS